MEVNAEGRRCPRCRVALEAMPDPTGAFLEICPACDGVLIEAGELERALRGQLPRASSVELPSPFASPSETLVCSICGAGSLRDATLDATARGARRCDACGGYFLDAAAFIALRREGPPDEPRIDTEGLELDVPARPEPSRPARAPAPAEAIRVGTGPVDETPERSARIAPDEALAHARFDVADPWARLLGLPIAFVVALPFATTEFGSLLGMPIRIQFHELGHAVVAWLSGRFAIPIPCGLTVWTDPPSSGAHLVVLLVAALLVIRGVRTKRRGFFVGAAMLELAHVLVATRDDSIASILLAGGASELATPAAVVIAFFLPMHDRLRWDFFRFPALGVAAIGYLGAMRLWLAVFRGQEEAPIGSLLGTTGDGSGDLERLVAEHGYSLARIVGGYVALGVAAGVAIVSVYAWFAIHAVTEIRRDGRRATS